MPGLIAGFCIAEAAVSGQLGSFQAAASDKLVAACFQAQARDEHRHDGFLDRVGAEVAAIPGPTAPPGWMSSAPSSLPICRGWPAREASGPGRGRGRPGLT